MLHGITINSLVGSAMHRQIRLPVSNQIQAFNADGPWDRLLENAGRHASAVPHDLTRQPYIHRDQLHIRIRWGKKGTGFTALEEIRDVDRRRVTGPLIELPRNA